MIRTGSLVIFNSKNKSFGPALIIKSQKSIEAHMTIIKHLLFTSNDCFWIYEEHLAGVSTVLPLTLDVIV